MDWTSTGPTGQVHGPGKFLYVYWLFSLSNLTLFTNNLAWAFACKPYSLSPCASCSLWFFHSSWGNQAALKERSHESAPQAYIREAQMSAPTLAEKGSSHAPFSGAQGVERKKVYKNCQKTIKGFNNHPLQEGGRSTFMDKQFYGHPSFSSPWLLLYQHPPRIYLLNFAFPPTWQRSQNPSPTEKYIFRCLAFSGVFRHPPTWERNACQRLQERNRTQTSLA